MSATFTVCSGFVDGLSRVLAHLDRFVLRFFFFFVVLFLFWSMRSDLESFMLTAKPD